MPLYDYVCAACGARFEDINAAEAPAPACPVCGSQETERQVSLPGPQKTGAFPFKIGPVHPVAGKMARGMGASPCGGCAGNGSCS